MSYIEVLQSIKARRAEQEISLGSGTGGTGSHPPESQASSVPFERFRSAMGQMQANADASIAVEIDRIINLPIVEDPTEEEIDKISRWYAPGGGFKLFPEQAKALMQYHAVGSLIAPVAVGGGKCVEGDTEILDSKRGRCLVRDLGSLEVPSMDRFGRVVYKKAVSVISGIKPCVRLITTKGQAVNLSIDHPVFTQRGWVPVKQLTNDDFIAIPRIIPEPKDCLRIPDEWVRIMAYLASDGGTSGPMPAFTNMDKKIIDELGDDLHKIGGKLSERKSRSKAREFRIRGISKYRDILYTKQLSKEKRVLPRYYLLTNKQIALFLNRFWACDGYVTKDKNTLEVILASEKLIDDLLYFLLRLGIVSSKRFKKTSYLKNGVRKHFSAYRLTVSGKDNVLKFFSTVGFPLGKEDSCKTIYDQLSSVVENTNTDVVPISTKEIYEIFDELKYPPMGGDRRYRKGRPRTDAKKFLGLTEGQYISRSKFSAWVKKVEYRGKYRWLCDADIYWTKIKSIEPRGMRAVYDLSVPKTHNFIGNSIFLHNTAISVLIANDAYTLFGKQKILLIEPSHLVNQLRYIELPKYRKHVSINVPFYWLAGESARRRLALAQSGRRGVYVVSYSLLSREDGAEVMNAIAPDLVIGDEIHRIASANPSARARRFREIVKRFRPHIVGLSGTITTKSPRDYHFLVTSALGEYSFIPRPQYIADEWSKIIDTNATNLDEFSSADKPQPGPYLKIVSWAKHSFPASKKEYTKDLVGFRRAHNKRMQTCPGVVCSSGKDLVGSSLRISNLHIFKAEKEACPGWEALQEKVKQLLELWIAPNGDEIEYALHIWRYRNELEGIGGYNDLSWPDVAKLSERRRISTAESEDILYRSKAQHNLQQEFAKKLREWIKKKAKTGLDTPMLIGQDMYRNGDKNVGSELYEAWTIAREAEFQGMVERDKSFVRLCPFRINRIVKWAKEWHKESPNKAAVVWYDNQGVGKWLRDAFQEADLPYVWCQADTAGRTNISDETQADKFSIATFNAFSEGLNIQNKYYAAAYSQWTRSAKMAEQSIGRLHRPGQPEDEVNIFYSICGEFDHVNLAACLNDSAYIHQTVGRQKLMIADYDETPKIIPYSVLVEWNAEPEGTTEESWKLLQDKFIEKRE